MTLQAEAARDYVRDQPARSDELLADLVGQLQAATADIRRLVYELRPPALDDLGLVGALRAHAARHGAGVDGLRLSIEASDRLPPLPAAVEVAAYRIAQEALTNVVRHAHARRCWLEIIVDDPPAGRLLRVEVRDDGRGVPAAGQPESGSPRCASARWSWVEPAKWMGCPRRDPCGGAHPAASLRRYILMEPIRELLAEDNPRFRQGLGHW